jgi:hypothetical protein
VGTHPQARLQATAVGKTLTTLQSWNGKLYSGFGDYGANTGPIALTPFDGVRFAPAPELKADTEAVWTFRVIGGKLYAPSIDPRRRSDFAVATSVGGGVSWSNPTVVRATHAYDVASLTGSDLWIVGSDGAEAAAWQSLDGGATWRKVLAVPSVSGIAVDYARFYGAGVYMGKLYLQATDFQGGPHPRTNVFDGTSWADGPSLGTFNHAQVFAGRLLYHGGFHAGWSSNHLKAFDGVGSETVLPSRIYDYTIHGTEVCSLASDGHVRRTTDLASWTDVARAPDTARSIAVFNGSIYVGGTDSTLYELRSDRAMRAAPDAS